MSSTAKVFAIVCLVVATFGYSIYEKKKFERLDQEAAMNPILQQLPQIELTNLYTKEKIDNTSLFNGARGAMVHFWGTWCGPCEAELPEFLDLAKHLRDQGVNFLLLAVNDDELKIKKFLKRFGELPSNVMIAHDKEGKYLPIFGTIKVPETYLFSRDGKNLNKFVGPQDWKLQAYQTRILNYLSKNSSKAKEIETH